MRGIFLGIETMNKLTPAEITEPDVVYIHPDKIVLPPAIKKELESFMGVRVQHTKTGEWGTKYVIPAYRMREWLTLAKQLATG